MTASDGKYPAAMTTAAVRFLTAVEPGTRVVVRYRIEGGHTDALGIVLSADAVTCVIETRRGPVSVGLADVVAAKKVPPPPAPRS